MIVTNMKGVEVLFEVAALHMDTDIIESLLMESCTKQEFFSAYEKEYIKRYNTRWNFSHKQPFQMRLLTLPRIKEKVKDLQDKRNEYIELCSVKKFELTFDEALSMKKVEDLQNRVKGFLHRQEYAIEQLKNRYTNRMVLTIIYSDGRKVIITGNDIIFKGSVPYFYKMKYAHYYDGKEEFDTEIGKFKWDDSTEQQEEKQNYLDAIDEVYCN